MHNDGLCCATALAGPGFDFGRGTKLHGLEQFGSELASSGDDDLQCGAFLRLNVGRECAATAHSDLKNSDQAGRRCGSI